MSGVEALLYAVAFVAACLGVAVLALVSDLLWLTTKSSK